MEKPQIGHFVAANEDFPEFKPPKVVRVGFVGYLTINYLPTHVLPNFILHSTLQYYLSTSSDNKSPPQACYPTPHHDPDIMYEVRLSWGRAERMRVIICNSHAYYYPPLFTKESKCASKAVITKQFHNEQNPPLDLTRGELHSDPR